MADGGIYDQLAGGFARYSTDVYWLAPHFEKMLYDNALLAMAYADAYSITGHARYRKTVEETIAFVNAELAGRAGGFYCALDADSEGVEGKYYTWTWQEWLQDTGGDELVEKHFGITEKGNWEHTNILHIAMPVQELAAMYGMTEEAVQQRVSAVKEKLRMIQKTRVRPATDDKCLLSWNALMSLALSKAGVALGNDAYIEQAKQHMLWMNSAYHVNGTWLHTWKNGVAKIPAKLDDYAYMIAAKLQLASASGDAAFIAEAAGLVEIVQQEFLHDDKSFFYFTSVKQTDIPARKTDLYDGSVPAANSVMAGNLVLCGMLMERSDWVEQGQFMLRQMAATTGRYATSFANWAVYGQRMVAGYKTAVASAGAGSMVFKNMREMYLPHVYTVAAGQELQQIPLLQGKNNNAEEQVYICDTASCMAPVKDVARIREILKINL